MFLQIVINGLLAGAIYALIAAGFSYIYNVHRFFYVAYGAVLASGAFAFYSALIIFRLPILYAIIFAVIITLVLSTAFEICVHKPLRGRKANDLLLFLSSTALLVLFQNILLLIFGPSVRTLKLPLQKTISLFSAAITPSQILIFISSICVFLILHVFLSRTTIGKAIRAISDDSLAASLVGINTKKLNLIIINISGLLACVAGILMSLEQDLRFDMGQYAILMGIVASIIGGIGNITAAIIGGIMLGLIQNISIWFLPSGYKQIISFGILIVFLLVRPHGLFGSKGKDAF